MNRAILISIRPEWTAKILNGEKPIEIRKTAPKCELPIDVYIYCTKGKPFVNLWTSKTKERCRKVILNISESQAYMDVSDFMNEEFMNKYPQYLGQRVTFDPTNLNGKVVAKFTMREIEIFDDFDQELCDRACLDRGEILDYLGTKLGYAWHISDLEIFDKPKELSEFMPPKWEKCGVKDENGLYQCDKCPYGDKANIQCKRKPLTKAPQSWCYVEEKV